MAFIKDTLVFDKKALYVASGQPISIDQTDANVNIYYYDSVTKEQRKIGSFQPLFVNEDEFKKEAKVLLDVYKDQRLNTSQVIEELSDFVESIYGHNNKQMLKLWLKAHFKI